MGISPLVFDIRNYWSATLACLFPFCIIRFNIWLLFDASNQNPKNLGWRFGYTWGNPGWSDWHLVVLPKV